MSEHTQMNEDNCDTPMTADTAFAYSDNFQICGACGCIALEHNETEAKALVAYLNGRNGGGYSFKRNRPDQVREAKRLRPGVPVYRHPLRDEAFDAMGIV